MQQVIRYIRFKDDDPNNPGLCYRLIEQWTSGNLKPALVDIVLFAAHKHFLTTGHPAVVTSLIRPQTNDSGVHADGRGADLRSRDLSDEQAKEWENSINAAYPWYGEYSSKPEAQTARIHAVRGEDGNSMGVHLHLQCGPQEPQPR